MSDLPSDTTLVNNASKIMLLDTIRRSQEAQMSAERIQKLLIDLELRNIQDELEINSIVNSMTDVISLLQEMSHTLIQKKEGYTATLAKLLSQRKACKSISSKLIDTSLLLQQEQKRLKELQNEEPVISANETNQQRLADDRKFIVDIIFSQLRALDSRYRAKAKHHNFIVVDNLVLQNSFSDDAVRINTTLIAKAKELAQKLRVDTLV